MDARVSLTTPEKLLRNGRDNNLHPETVLKQLFDLDYFLKEKGSAFVKVSSMANLGGGHYGEVTGARTVRESELNKHVHTVKWCCNSPLLLGVFIHDHIDETWYKVPSPLKLT